MSAHVHVDEPGLDREQYQARLETLQANLDAAIKETTECRLAERRVKALRDSDPEAIRRAELRHVAAQVAEEEHRSILKVLETEGPHLVELHQERENLPEAMTEHANQHQRIAALAPAGTKAVWERVSADIEILMEIHKCRNRVQYERLRIEYASRFISGKDQADLPELEDVSFVRFVEKLHGMLLQFHNNGYVGAVQDLKVQIAKLTRRVVKGDGRPVQRR